MIDNYLEDPFKNITTVSIVDAKKVFYPLRYALQKRDILFDASQCLSANLLPEDLSYPSSAKNTDAGQLLEYKVSFSITNQFKVTESQLQERVNRKVIVVLHYTHGRIILGCNEHPFIFSYSDDNTTSPAGTPGYTIECTGSAIIPKVII